MDSDLLKVFADYHFFRGHRFEDVAWARITDYVSFVMPLRLQHEHLVSRYRTPSHADLYKVTRGSPFFGALMSQQVVHRGEHKQFDAVLDLWNAQGVRCLAQSRKRGHRQNNADELLTLQLPDALLHLISRGCLQDVAMPVRKNISDLHTSENSLACMMMHLPELMLT